MQHYNSGLDALANWETDTYRWALLTAGTFDATNVVVADLFVAGTETVASGYTRQDVTVKVRAVDDAGSRVTYSADGPDFGTLGAEDDITAVALYQVVTDDSDSLLVGWWAITPTAPDAISPFTLDITDGIVAYVDAA